MDLTTALPLDVSGSPAVQLLVNVSEQDIAALLEEQNLRHFDSLDYSVAYLLTLSICGLLGNTLVFVVYLLRLKTYPMRAYIMAMSVCDFLTNCFSLPMEVVAIRIHFTFSSTALCSVSWTIMCFLLLFSGALLAAVAFDRQVLVCQQHQRNSRRLNRDTKFLLLCFVLSLLISLPWLGSLELETVAIPGTGLQGTVCAFVKGSALVQVMNYVNNALFVVGFVIICYSYGRIAWRLREHRRQKKKKTTAEGCVGTASAAVTARSAGFSQNEASLEIDVTETSQRMDSADFEAAEETAVDGNRPPVTTATCFNQQLNVDTLPPDQTSTCTKAEDRSFPRKMFSLRSFKDGHLVWKEAEEKKKAKVGGGGGGSGGRSRKRISNRTTLMLFVLSVVFCLNYVPYLAIVVQRNLQSEEDIIKALGHNVYYILVRSLYINSAINPFIYGIYSPRFRRECVRFFCCKA